MTRPLSPETKIGIPLALVGALICWNLHETIGLKERMARIEGRMDTAYVAPMAPAFPDMPEYHVALAHGALPFQDKGRSP